MPFILGLRVLPSTFCKFFVYKIKKMKANMFQFEMRKKTYVWLLT